MENVQRVHIVLRGSAGKQSRHKIDIRNDLQPHRELLGFRPRVFPVCLIIQVCLKGLGEHGIGYLIRNDGFLLRCGKISHQNLSKLLRVDGLDQYVRKTRRLVKIDIFSALLGGVADYRDLFSATCKQLLELYQCIHAVKLRHAVIEKDQVVVLFLAQLQALLAALHLIGQNAVRAQKGRQHGPV